MDKESLMTKLNNIRTATNRGTRALHKPLLLLYALGQYQQNGTSYIPFEEAHPKLKQLLREYGPPVKQIQTSNPFVRYYLLLA